MGISQLIFCKCKRKCKFSVHCIAVLSLRENHYGSGVKDNCNMLVIGILYNGETEGIDCGFPCFLPEYDAVFHAEKLQKGLFFSPVSPNLGRVTRPMNPISLPSTPQNSTSAPLFRCPEPRFLIPQTAFWDTPNGQMGVFYNTSCCHSYGCFTPLKRVFLPSHSVEIGHKTHVYAPSKTDPPFDKTHIRCREP